jgi:hypothetical protein
MKYLRRIFLRFFSLFTNSKAEAELDREIAAGFIAKFATHGAEAQLSCEG